jgi:two-component system chemotaxis family response regulator WspR
VLSTKEDPLIKSAAFAAGANDYLVKLPDTIELVARIRYHSRSYMTLLQRDAAYRALRVSQQQLLDTNLVLQRLMNSDGLTGLSNRRHFDEYLELEWRRAMREQSQLSLLMIDVDYFKAYNDSFGHVEGDEALRKVAGHPRSQQPPFGPAGALRRRRVRPGAAQHLAGRGAAGGRKAAPDRRGAEIPHMPERRLEPDHQHRPGDHDPGKAADCRQLISAADKGLYRPRTTAVTRSASSDLSCPNVRGPPTSAVCGLPATPSGLPLRRLPLYSLGFQKFANECCPPWKSTRS